MRKIFYHISLMTAVILFASIVGMLLLIFCAQMPSANVKDNLYESYSQLLGEGVYPNLYGDINSGLDNYTDAIMLTKSGYTGNASALEVAALGIGEFAVGAESSWESAWMLYNNPEAETKDTEYSRYWLGFRLFLKPLLGLFTYSQIRNINLAMQVGLCLLCLFILAKKKELRAYIPAYVALFLIQDVYLTSRSLQFSSVFYVYLIGTIFLLLFYKHLEAKKLLPYYFLFLGMLTSYFDFLTYPLVTYGIPMTTYLILEKKKDVFSKLKNIVTYGLCWILGYAGMWLGKGLVGSVVVKQNLFPGIFSAVLFRSGSNNYSSFNRFSSIRENLYYIRGTVPITYVYKVCFLVAIILIIFVLKKRIKIDFKRTLSEAVPYLLISITPICWFFVLANHTWIHKFFTNKALFVTAFSLICLLTELWIGILRNKNMEEKNCG